MEAFVLGVEFEIKCEFRVVRTRMHVVAFIHNYCFLKFACFSSVGNLNLVLHVNLCRFGDDTGHCRIPVHKCHTGARKAGHAELDGR
jgi:hypothetical protein